MSGTETETPAEENYRQLTETKALVGEGHFNEMLGLSMHDKCRWCGKPVAHSQSKSAFVHIDDEGVPVSMGRGCRSASYDYDAPEGEEPRDMRLKPHWKASPKSAEARGGQKK